MKNYIDKPDILKRYINNILLIMRLTTVIFMVSMFQVSASTVAKEFNYVRKEVLLVQIFKEIKKQTGYNIIWNEKKIDVTATIDANFKKATIHDVSNKSLSNLPLSYSINDKMMIKEKESSFGKKLADFLKSIEVKGKVVDQNGQPLEGAIVRVKGSKKSTSANNNGEFLLRNVDENAFLVISFVGYEPQEVKVSANIGVVILVLNSEKLKEVEIVSTGYQDLRKKRATGSFTVIDNNLLERAVSSDLLSRLRGVTNGLLIDRPTNTGNNLGISIRGRSTIFSNTTPLIVIDNFPFEGNINTINPNDVENVTLLKDAAAASIWGVRAGNGVIVITTKKGKLNQRTSVNLTSNITIGNKPDLKYVPQLNSSDFIDLEKFLFSEGYYEEILGNGYELISPVVELLSKRTSANADLIDASIEDLKQYDLMKQIDKYFYRKSFLQQYYLNLNGGGSNVTYNISAGYDRNQTVNEGNSNGRFTFKANNSYDLLDKKLRLITDITFVQNTLKNDNNDPFSGLYPYQQIADINGNPLPVLSTATLRASYTDTAGNGRLLDWKYRPLDELRRKSNSSINDLTDLRVNTIAKYQIINPLSLSINYQFYRSSGSNELLRDLASFQTRNEINRVTQINSSTSAITYPMPLGAQFTKNEISSNSHFGRLQFDFNETLFGKHVINSLLGYEIRSEDRALSTVNLFGYDPDTKNSISPDNVNAYSLYYQPGMTRFNTRPASLSATLNNYVSFYANASYMYDEKYILSGSYRKDESNLFGVNANKKGVPLWSTGLTWNINREKFFNVSWIPRLQLKASFGYNGNVNQSLSAYTTATTSPFRNVWGDNFLAITNPPNPLLGWERVRNINLGIDFSLINDFISGSIEYYNKKGIELIGTSPIAQQTGISVFTGNVADTKTNGLDIQLNSRNIDNNLLKWHTTVFLNISKDKITKYMANTGSNLNIATALFISPIVGYPIRSVFSFKSTQLDTLGNPQGFINGEISKNYSAITRSTNINELLYHGSAVPTVFGGLRNTFSHGAFELSFNLSFKFGYYFRRTALRYASLYGGNDFSGEYDKRWKNPGDQLTTSVPSLIYPESPIRDSFYAFSQTTVERGDHIRINDLKLSYFIPKAFMQKLKIRAFSVYAYASNLGILWRANKFNLDPDMYNEPPVPLNVSLGFKTNF